MSDITITIHGGNNQILPNATEAIQNFYVGEYCGETSLEEGDGRSGLMPETIRFRAYINKEEDLERYLAQSSAGRLPSWPKSFWSCKRTS